MTSQTRQNALFAAEDWRRLYEVLSNIDFRAADQDTLKAALVGYVRTNYPEEFNDWINSSEFVIKLNVLLWLSQNIMYRADLNSRENFVATAERRESLLMLAQNAAYPVDRVRGATGEVHIDSIQTNQQLYDSDGSAIANKIVWNDPTDPDWQEKWNVVMNAALNKRTQFGRPLRRYSTSTSQVSVYRLNSLAPASGVYPFTVSSSGNSLNFEITNVDLDPSTGLYTELSPNPANAMQFVYRTDGYGAGSPGTGWFLPVKQGRMSYQDETFSNAVPMTSVDINVVNVNQTDIWVTEVNSTGDVIEEWTQVDNTYGKGLAFTTGAAKNIFEVITRNNDMITIRFGDGKFGAIPIGRFRFWFRSSSQNAGVIRSSDIRNRTVIVPYASGGIIYNLIVKYSLTTNITNAAGAESNADIKSRLPKVVYSQDRMINAEDYNSFPLRDSSILKVKTVNRTFAGHGLSSPLKDPTGTYNNVKLIAEDGRIYQTMSKTQTNITADASVLSPRSVVDSYISPLLKSIGKFNLYYNNYEENRLTRNISFSEDSTVGEGSRGRFVENSGISQETVVVGSSLPQSDPLFGLSAECLVRFESFDGPLARINFVVGNGTAENAVLFKTRVGDGSRVYSTFPAYRFVLTPSEKDSIISRINLKRSFAMRWNSFGNSWIIINPEDIDSSSAFDVKNGGDTSGTSKDASWMIRMEYRSLSNGDDQWVIEDNNLNVFFESDREIDFYYANTSSVYDTETGRLLRDNVKVLRDNETRDSVVRRGVVPAFGINPNKGSVSVIADGSSTSFSLRAINVNTNHVFVSSDGVPTPSDEWSIVRTNGFDAVSFDTTPSAGTRINMTYDTDRSYATTSRRSFVGDDTSQVFNTGQYNLSADNVWCFIDGKIQAPFIDYTVLPGSGASRVSFSSVPGDDLDITFLGASGIAPAFYHVREPMDGTSRIIETHTPSSRLWVFVDGLLVRNGFSVDASQTDNVRVIFDGAPSSGSVVDVKIALYPQSVLSEELDTTLVTGQSQFSFVGTTDSSAGSVMVWINGEEGAFSFENGVVYLSIPGQDGDVVYALCLKQVAGLTTGNSVMLEGGFKATPEYITQDAMWSVTGSLRHADGYINQNGIEISNVDLATSGEAINPFQFREFVLQDGSDMVVWRLINQGGADVWDPLSETTVPMGTLKDAFHNFEEGESFSTASVPSGSVHWDGTRWLIADSDTLMWIVAGDQLAYRKEIGRGGIRFIWSHYASDAERIDPSPSNIHDVFVLTQGYDTLVRDWIANRGDAGDEPGADTSEQLRIQYSNTFDPHKAISDSLVWRPARYKLLFGPQSDESLRAKFMVVKIEGSTVPDNDLKLRVLTAIDNYFSVDNWDFGDSFYFSELCAYIHLQLSNTVQSVVVVPTGPNQKFGRLFQVRAEIDELFVSSASADDVEITTNLSDTTLRIL